ncbi:MAG: leucyl aminopeptidase [Acidobacteriota bacterium]
MDITISGKPLSEISSDVLIIPVFESDTPTGGALTVLDELTNGLVTSVFASGEVKGKRDYAILLHTNSANHLKRLLFYGAGKAESFTPLSLQRLAAAAVRKLSGNNFASLAFLLTAHLENETRVQALAEGVMLGAIKGNLYHTDNDDSQRLSHLEFICESADAGQFIQAIETAKVMAEAVNFARHLTYEPGNVITPTRLAEHAAEMAAREGLACTLIDESEMKELGMGALLGVSRGSEEPAKLIVLRHEPAGADPSQLIALVGKGITFDSGGISIKPASGMEEMKNDMGGGAAVIGAMQIIARLKPNVRVIGLIAASENMPSGRAYKPGDVLRSLSGKTIEVVNTDAEGRLVLADALTYAVNQGATQIIDAATLTGACVVALGDVRAAVMGTDQQLIDGLLSAGETCGEPLWQLPANKEYGDLIRSDIADVKNSGGRLAGAITAGMFLKMFAGNVAWAHLDIAGPVWYEDEKPFMAKGATGFGTRLMASYVLSKPEY